VILVRLVLVLLVTAAAAAEDCVNCQTPHLPSVLDDAEVPTIPDLVTIRTPLLERNPRATYCTRADDVADTIVFHHSATDSSETIQQLNERHLDEGGSDPWLMLGYHYTINAPYRNERAPALQVSQGRPLNIVGSHAGTNVYRPVSASTRTVLARRDSLLCSNSRGRWAPPSAAYRLRRDTARANLNTIGVVIIGNYAPLSLTNFDGYDPANPRWPTESVIDTAARLACQIQRRHPRVTKLTSHSEYQSTLCPGLIQQRVGQIRDAARRYGCEFN
jgi:hypothetical protein